MHIPKYFFLVLFSLVSLGTACSVGNSAATKTGNQPRTLVMGTSADYPPFEFRKHGEVVGLDIDIAREICNELGYDLKIQNMDFNALIPALDSGHVDFAMSGLTITEERKENLAFSEVYFQNSLALLIGPKVQFAEEKDFANKKIGAQLGSTMERVGKEKVKKYPGLQLIALSTNTILIEDLKSRRLDGVIVEKAQARAFVKVFPDLRVLEFPGLNPAGSDGYAVAFPRGTKRSSEVQLEFKHVLEKLKQNGKLQEIQKKWLEEVNA